MAKNIGFINISSLLKRINLKEIIATTHPSAKIHNKGASRCPLHEDSTPSFAFRTINDIDYWTCFAGCGKGTVIDWLKIVNGHSVEEAVQFLIDIVSETDPQFSRDDYSLAELKREIEKTTARNQFWDSLMQNMRHDLLNSDMAEGVRQWLTNRGISNLEYLKYFPVGYYNYELLKQRFPAPELRKYGLENVESKYGKDVVAFFYHANFNEISKMKIRKAVAGDHQEEFMGKYDDDLGFFGLGMFDKGESKDIVIVEGEMDALVVQTKCMLQLSDKINLVCRSGFSGASFQAVQKLVDLDYQKVTLWPDDDKGGDEFIQKFAQSARNSSLILNVATPSAYGNRGTGPKKDPAYLAETITDIRDLLKDVQINTKLLATYLAMKEIKKYKFASKQNPQDLAVLKKQLAQQAAEYRLSGFDLEGYADYINSNLPEISKETLIREAERADRQFSTVKIGEIVYGMDASGYAYRKVKPKTEEEYFVKLGNFFVKYDKIIEFDGETEKIIEGSILLEGKRAARFVEPSSTFSSGDDIIKFVRAHCPIGIQSAPELSRVLPNLVGNSQDGVKMVRGVDKIGFLDKETTYVTPSYIVRGGAIIPNDEIKLRPNVDPLVMRYDFYHETDMSILQESMNLIHDHLLDLHDRRLTLIMLAHCMGSVLPPFLERRTFPHVLFHQGRFGTGKTTSTKIFMNLFADWDMEIQGPHASGTKNSIEAKISYIKNAPIFVDDIKGGRHNAQQMMEIIQSQYDMQGRSRLTSNYTLARTYNMQCFGLIFDGEDVPVNEPSTLSRMLVVESSPKGYNMQKSNTLQASRNLLRALTPHYIAYLQKKYKDEPLKYVDLTKVQFSNDRTYYQLMHEVTSLNEYLTFWVDFLGFSEVRKEELIKEIQEIAGKLYIINTQHVKAKQQEETFLDGLRELISAGYLSLSPDPFKNNQVGYIKDEFVFVFPGVAVSEVNKLLRKRFDATSVGKDLAARGFLERGSKKEITQRRGYRGSKVRVWQVKKGALIDETSMAELQTAEAKADGDLTTGSRGNPKASSDSSKSESKEATTTTGVESRDGWEGYDEEFGELRDLSDGPNVGKTAGASAGK